MHDLWIDRATVVDGTGAPSFPASVGVDGGRISTIVRHPTTAEDHEAAVRLEAGDLVLAPGFVDVHNHSDLAPLVDPTMPSTTRQGVTSVVVGNCGDSPFPFERATELASWAGGEPEDMDLRSLTFASFLERIERARPAVHVASLVGHGSIRQEVMGTARLPPTAAELRAMRHLVAEAMAAGAVGLSTGLVYVPDMYATTDEVVALAEEAAAAGGIYASHIRGEGRHLFRAVDEAIEVGKRAGLPVHISHLKCESSFVWGRAGELLATIHAADDVTADQYPYAAWASVLASLLPAWAPVQELPELLTDAPTRSRLVEAVEHGQGDDFQSSVDGVGWDRIVIESTADVSCNGLSIAAIAEARDIEPVEACFQLLIEAPTTACIGHAMHEDDVRTILADAEVMVASDAIAMAPDGPVGTTPVHPRTYGTFPQVVGQAVRDGVLSLEAAVRKMTSLPADRFGLRARGRIVEGFSADLVLFDPTTIEDRSTFERPHRFPAGIEAVVVEGTVAWRREMSSIQRAGTVLRDGAGEPRRP